MDSFVINIINLLGALYLISINLFLILISKLVPLTLELARTLNMFIRLKVMLLNIVKKSMKGPVRIFFGQSKIHVMY